MNQEDEQERETREMQPMQTKDHANQSAEGPPPLSQFLASLHTQFGTDFNEDDVAVYIRAIEERLRERTDLEACVLMMEPDEAQPIFGQAVTETVQSVFEERYTFYTKLIDNKDSYNHLVRKLFKRFQLLNKGQRKSGGNDE